MSAGPAESDSCKLFTGSELASAAGFDAVFNESAGTLRDREGLGKSVFCFFAGVPSANVLVFTDTSAGLDGIVSALEAQDLGSAAARDLEELGDVAGGTGYPATADGRSFGRWIAGDGSWGLSQVAASLDRAGIEGTVQLARVSLT